MKKSRNLSIMIKVSRKRKHPAIFRHLVFTNLFIITCTPMLILSAAGKDDLVIERKARQTFRDSVNKVREIHRNEQVLIKGQMVKIIDTTFKQSIVIRPDKKLCWLFDILDQKYSELTFDEIAKWQKEHIESVKAIKARVKGSSDEKELEVILMGYGEFKEGINAEVKNTGKNQHIIERTCTEKNLIINKDIFYMSAYFDESIPEHEIYFQGIYSIGGFKPAMYASIKKINGFPLKGTIRYTLFDQRVESKEEVTRLERKTIDQCEFEIPSGFRQVPYEPIQTPPARVVEKPKEFKQQFTEDDIEEKSLPFTDRQ